MSTVTLQARDALPAGTRLKDYDIEGLLGVGGFGLVYRAREDALQRVVAIKEYLPSSLAMRGDDGQVILRSPEYAEPFALGMRSFINEARLLARFDHPALVRVIRFWEERGTAYMVMPCYLGPTLYEARRALPGPPTQAWMQALMEPLLGALECLHREQVYHRDVAPDNILLIDDVDAPCGIRPVLLDFGAARRVISDHTQALTAILKPSFAPIEQYAETTTLKQGPWTDLYGLGAVLHYCITGRTPVPATARAIHDDLPLLSQMAPGLAQDFGQSYPPGLLASIDQALAVRPESRLASVAAWREALARPGAQAASGAATVASTQLNTTPDEPAPGAPGDAGATANTQAPRAIWNERTVVVGSPHGAAAAADEPPTSFDATVPAHGPAAQASPGRGILGATGGQAQRWPRGLAWGLGALVLAGVLALSAWSVQRHRQEAASAGAATLPQAGLGGTDGGAGAGGVLRSPDQPDQALPVRSDAPSAAPGGGAQGASGGAVLAASASGAQEAGGTPGQLGGGKELTEAERKKEARAQAKAKAQAKAEARKARAEARASEASAAAEAPPPALNPRRACGGRVFIALAICMKRYCGRPEYTRHAECARMREQERANREAQRSIYP